MLDPIFAATTTEVHRRSAKSADDQKGNDKVFSVLAVSESLVHGENANNLDLTLPQNVSVGAHPFMVQGKELGIDHNRKGSELLRAGEQFGSAVTPMPDDLDVEMDLVTSRHNAAMTQKDVVLGAVAVSANEAAVRNSKRTERLRVQIGDKNQMNNAQADQKLTSFLLDANLEKTSTKEGLSDGRYSGAGPVAASRIEPSGVSSGKSILLPFSGSIPFEPAPRPGNLGEEFLAQRAELKSINDVVVAPRALSNTGSLRDLSKRSDLKVEQIPSTSISGSDAHSMSDDHPVNQLGEAKSGLDGKALLGDGARSVNRPSLVGLLDVQPFRFASRTPVKEMEQINLRPLSAMGKPKDPGPNVFDARLASTQSNLSTGLTEPERLVAGLAVLKNEAVLFSPDEETSQTDPVHALRASSHYSAAQVAPQSSVPSEVTSQSSRATGFSLALAEQLDGVKIVQGATLVQLSPRGLGTVEVEMVTGPDQSINVVIRADNPTVLASLRDIRDILVTMLNIEGGGSLSFENRSDQNHSRLMQDQKKSIDRNDRIGVNDLGASVLLSRAVITGKTLDLTA